MSKSTIGAFSVLGTYISWGILPIFWKSLGFADSTYIMAMRILWSTVFYFLFVAIQKKLKIIPNIIRNPKQCLYMFITGLALTINWWVYIYAVNKGHIIEASLAYYINPMLAILSGAFFFREKLSRLQWLAALIAGVGILYSVVAYGVVPYSAILIAVAFVIYGCMKKVSRVDADVSLFLETVFMAPFALIFVIFAETSGQGYIMSGSISQIILFPLSGIVTAIPLILYSRGIELTSMSLSGVLMFINPTLQVLVAVIMYGEQFSQSDYVMFPCVWLGVLIFIGNNLITAKRRKLDI